MLNEHYDGQGNMAIWCTEQCGYRFQFDHSLAFFDDFIIITHHGNSSFYSHREWKYLRSTCCVAIQMCPLSLKICIDVWVWVCCCATRQVVTIDMYI